MKKERWILAKLNEYQSAILIIHSLMMIREVRHNLFLNFRIFGALYLLLIFLSVLYLSFNQCRTTVDEFCI
jgi:hypothetical protein